MNSWTVGQAIAFCGLPDRKQTQGRKTSAGVGARLWSEPPACHAAIPGGILSAGRCPQESGHGRPEAHSTGANQGASPTIGVFHEIPRAAGPLKQTTKNDRLRHQTRGTALSSYFLETTLASNRGFRGQELTEIREIVIENRMFFLEQWHEYFSGKQ